MRILVLLMFLTSSTLSMGLHRVVDPGDGCYNYHHDQSKMMACLAEQTRERMAEFVESATPACKEIAVKLQECKSQKEKGRCLKYESGFKKLLLSGRINFPRCLYYQTACELAGVSMEKYSLCERKETQRQLQEIQDQLQGIQEAGESVSSASEKEKIEKFLRDRRPPVVRKQVGFRSP